MVKLSFNSNLYINLISTEGCFYFSLINNKEFLMNFYKDPYGQTIKNNEFTWTYKDSTSLATPKK